MPSFIVPSNERAILSRNGVARAFLPPGKHRFFSFGQELSVTRFDISQGASPVTPEVAALLPPEHAEVVEIAFGTLGLLRIDGRPTRCLEAGRHAIWKGLGKPSLELLSLTPLLLSVPEGFELLVPVATATPALVLTFQRALVFCNGRIEQVLAEGKHWVSRHGRDVAITMVDLREQELQITSQELMTADKASLRLNIVVKYRVVDAARSQTSVANLYAALYSEAQLALRRYTAGLSIEQMLERRSEANETMRGMLDLPARSYGVELTHIDIKDIVLPGDLKNLFNQVIEAEKKAQAEAIARREETAATRSLANTAKLLENNPTLLRLKELETYKAIAEKVGSITVVASPAELGASLSLRGPQAR